ncbi:hypothetical protein BJX65DRAFT_315274 [Aspergillus insuetus]
MVYAQRCGNCIESFAASPNGTAASDPVPVDFQEFLDYCDSIGNGTEAEVDINALLSSWSFLQATQSAIQMSFSSLGYNVSTTMTTTTSVSVPTTAATDPAVESRNTTATDASGSPDVSIIVAAVVVPVVNVPLLLTRLAVYGPTV